MRFLADLFVSHRSAAGVMMVVVTTLATVGYLKPAETRRPLEKYQTQIDEEQETVGELVADRFDLSRSDAFLVVEVDELFRPEMVAALREMVRALESMPSVDTVLWADRVPNLNVFGIAQPLLPPDAASRESFEQARDEVLKHPLVEGQLLSPDGHTLLMPIVYDWLRFAAGAEAGPTNGTSHGADAVEAAEIDDERLVEEVLATAKRSLAASLGEDALTQQSPGASPEQSTEPSQQAITTGGEQLSPKVRVRLTGNVPLFVAQRKAFDRNQVVFRTIGYALAFVLSIIMFRGVAAVFVVSAAPMLAVYWSLGLVSLLGIPTNPLADVVMPLLISMVGLTDGVHLLVHIRRERAAGLSPVEAARSAIEKVGLACWLTSLTTAVGFGSLMLAESEFVREFGRVCTFGVLVGFVAVVSFIPLACSTRLGRHIERGNERDLVGYGVARLGSLVSALVGYRYVVSIAAVALTITLLAVSTRLNPDNRLATAMPSSSAAYQALAHCDRVLGGIEFVQVEVAWPDSVGSEDPRVLEAVMAAERLIDKQPLLQYPVSVTNLLATFPTGGDDDLSTKMTFLTLLPNELKGFFYNARDHRATIVVRMQDRGIATYTPVFNELEADLEGLQESEFAGFDFRLTGRPVQVSRDLFQIVTDLRTSLITASAIIFCVLAIVYRSMRAGIVSIVPNVLPLAATGAMLVGLGRSLDMSSVCAFVVCLGIAVDDTIHFLSRFRQEMEVDHDTPAAIRRAFVGVGTALVMTTVILVCGFGAMLWSDLPGHRTFAAMAVMTITGALVGDMIALPALLAVVWPKASGGLSADDEHGLQTADQRDADA